ncbi:MAG: hypothetical protein AAF985_20370, partial [Bacteroidota bacterium]
KTIQLSVSKRAPVIHYFRSTKKQLVDLDPTVLNWDVSGAEHVVIDNGVGEVSKVKTVPFFSRKDTVLTLTATSYFGVKSTAQITIQVSKAAPSITFHTSSYLIQKGQKVQLSWKVSGATSIQIQPGIGLVKQEGTRMVRPLANIKYRIIAESIFGQLAEEEIAIELLKAIPLSISSKLAISKEKRMEPIPLKISQPNLTMSQKLDIPIPDLNFSKK